MTRAQHPNHEHPDRERTDHAHLDHEHPDRERTDHDYLSHGTDAFPAHSWAPNDTIGNIAGRCFRGRDGDHLLLHLRRLTIERRPSPDVGETTLRHLEGQRWLCSYLENLVRRNRHHGRKT